MKTKNPEFGENYPPGFSITHLFKGKCKENVDQGEESPTGHLEKPIP